METRVSISRSAEDVIQNRVEARGLVHHEWHVMSEVARAEGDVPTYQVSISEKLCAVCEVDDREGQGHSQLLHILDLRCWDVRLAKLVGQAREQPEEAEAEMKLHSGV